MHFERLHQITTTAAGAFATLLVVTGLLLADRLSNAQWLLVLFCAWILLLIATRVPLPERLPTFNRSLIRTSLVIASVFVILSAQLVRIQVANSDAIYHQTAIAPDGETIGNPRLTDQTLAIQRGEMFDRNGVLIAGTEEENGRYLRYYPDPSTAAVAGYYSPLLYGASGLEASWNNELSGRSGNNPFTRVINDLLNRPQRGADLYLTLDVVLQQQAMGLLGGNPGSVVVMDSRTGEVLVLASNPTIDPNQLFTASPEQNGAATTYWESLLASPDAPLVSRATLGLFTPGSTFKSITAAIGIELGLIEPDEVFIDDGDMVIDGRVLVENNRPDDARSEWTVAEGLAWSLNVVFAQIGLRIGGDHLWRGAEEMGFGASIPFDLPVSRSQVATNRTFLNDPNALADTAFGQGELLVTPLFMCMVTGMIANAGEMMEPYLVQRVVDEGTTTATIRPDTWRTPISEATANQVAAMMIDASINGTVRGAQVPGYTVGGKTGTAETGDGTAHSWFIGFIGDAEPRYAVAVVLEGGSGGLGNAVSIGRDMLQATITRVP